VAKDQEITIFLGCVMATLTISKQQKRSLKAVLPKSDAVDKKLVASIILGGGEGTRLHPLTLTRCKPAINFGGKYRLIDVPISNSIHAECHRIFVLTQFLSSSLHHHIFQTYMQGGRASGLIEILTAEQRPTNKAWFQGTADAVRQNIDYILESPVEYFLILSGDQLYNINFQEMIRFAQEKDVDVVVAALPVNGQDASRMGILKVDQNNHITDFYEKPQDKATLHKLRSSPEILEKVRGNHVSKRHYLGSMGIYLFKRKALVELLQNDPRADFGKHLIPTKVQKGGIAAYLYDGYWEDIGTIESFYEANMALTKPEPQFSFHNEFRPIFTSRYDLPPAKFSHTQIDQTILCEGAVIEGDEITRSLIGPRSIIQKGSIIRDSYIMGNDYYTSTVCDVRRLPCAPQIGENCIIKKAIIDKNVFIGKGVQLINKQKLTNYDGDNVFVRDGIIIVPRGATLPDGFIL
jgi:glucose-1-phosphate adenylyltransferase